MDKYRIAIAQCIYGKTHNIHQLRHSHTFTTTLQSRKIVNHTTARPSAIHSRIRRRVKQVTVTGKQVLKSHRQNIQSVNSLIVPRRTVHSRFILHVQIGHEHFQLRNFIMRNANHTQTLLIGLGVGIPHTVLHIELCCDFLQRTANDCPVIVSRFIGLFCHQNELLHLRRKQRQLFRAITKQLKHIDIAFVQVQLKCKPLKLRTQLIQISVIQHQMNATMIMKQTGLRHLGTPKRR